ncbi:MAG: MFS transporter [Promethearchaeota archaeon]|nr:MAG: MFS transporter [Candidatus Lokiarchaeota archaeon]
MNETSPNERSIATESKSKTPEKIPLLVFFSFAFGDLLIELYVAAFGVRVFDFFENEVGLATGLIALAFIIYAGWNMINDPLVGFLADKPRSFWRKHGKRFIWIISGGIGTSISFILIFAAPELDPKRDWIILFLWLLVTICLFDTFFSMFDTNYNGLIPDKFRTDEQRLRISSFEVGLGIFGTVAGVVIPPILITYGVRSSFLTMAIVIGIIGIILIILQIHGIREDKSMIDRYFKTAEQLEKVTFFDMIKIAVKQRSFLGYLLLYTLYQATIALLLGSIPYLVRFILKEEAITESYILLGYIIAGLASVPLWAKVALKKGNKKVFLIGGFMISALTVPFLFISDLLSVIIVAALIGVGLIGFWLMLNPILADVIDEAVVNNKLRQEGFYMGVRTFFGRMALIIQALTFAFIHIFTGFEPGSTTQTSTAILGLRIQMALVPMMLMILGLLIFWRLYDITPEKKASIQAELKRLNL